MKHMRRLAAIALGCAITATAFAQDKLPAPTAPTTQPVVAADPLLGKLFRSRTAGVQFNPPAGGAIIRDLNSGDIVRFVYSDESWDVRLKPISLHVPVELSSPPDKGVLELSARQLTDSNPTAEIVQQAVMHVDGREVGLIQARYNAGTERIYAQQAIVSDFEQSRKQYFSLQMTSKGKPKDAPANQADADETRASEIFQHMVKSVQPLDRDKLAQEQLRRVFNTRELWMLLDKKAIVASIQPVHFMRVVRDGHDVGVIQINEREATHNGRQGVEIIIHSNVEIEQAGNHIAATPQVPAVESTGIVLPKGFTTAAGPTTQAVMPQGIYTFSTFFVTFDRDHEDWSTITQAGHEISGQINEDGVSDIAIHHRADPTKHQIEETSDYSMNVGYRVFNEQGHGRDQQSVQRKLTPFYLPQALGQLLPRLLPIDHHAEYMFAFYVGGQREVMGRYVDVGTQREVDLEGQKVQAIPIADRIGADGVATTHYVSRNGEWLGSISEDGRLEVFPSDAHTLSVMWGPAFKVADEPPPFVDMQKAPRHEPRISPDLKIRPN